MEYNENDFEGQNLHLAGEDSAKVPSVLGPYTLPKFEFDDSLNGQLRFDSLVENEDFLGITSQEDSHWIENFSQAGNGIEFTSNAAESCSFPSRINVWSEATSSESVEMLLKAVVQEDTDREHLTLESDQINEQITSNNEMDNPLMKDDKNPDSNYRDSSEVEGSGSRPAHDTESVPILAEDILVAQESVLSSSQAFAGAEVSNLVLGTDCSIIEIKKTNSGPGETWPLENESVSNQLNDKFLDPGKVFDNNESSSQKIVTVVESAEEDAATVPGPVEAIISLADEGKDMINKNDVGMMGISVESGVTERDSVSLSSNLESAKEDLGVKSPACIPGRSSSNDGEGVSISANDMSEDVAVDIELAGSSSYGTVIASAKGITQPSDSHNVSYENSSLIVAGEGREDIGIKSNSSDSLTGCNTEVMQGSVVKLVDQDKSFVAGEDIPHECNSSLEAQHPSFKPTGYSDVVTDTIEMDCQKDRNDINDLVKSKSSTIDDDLCGNKSVVDVEKDLKDATALQIDSQGDHNLNSNLLLDDVRQPSTEVLNSDFDFKTSSTEAEGLLDVTDATLKSSETNILDKGVETLPQAAKQSSDSVSVECLKSDKLASPVILMTVPQHDSVIEETMESSQATFVSESSNFSVLNEPCDELNKRMEQSENDAIAIHEIAASEIETPKEETEGKDKHEISAFSVGHCMIETAAPKPGADDFSLVGVDSEAPGLKNNDVKNVDDVLVSSGHSEFDISVEETRSTNSRRSRPRVTSVSGKDIRYPVALACKTSPKTDKADSLKSDIATNISSPAPSLGSLSEDLTSPSDRKSRRGSSKSVKGSAKRNQVKEPTSSRKNEKGDKSSQFVSPLGSSQLVNLDSSLKPRGSLAIPSSGLPDLNNLIPSSAFFRQPFTDLQQVQLRAQIIVYGSLIQGAVPDEACMISAFDGDRTNWEPSWRVCVDRIHVGKSKGNIADSTAPTRLDSKVPDHDQRQSFSESGIISSAAAHARIRGVASPAVNAMIPLSSPLWTMPTPSVESGLPMSTNKSAVPEYQIVSPLNHYHTPPVRNYAANTSWLSQAPFPVPWLAPAHSSPFDFNTSSPAFPITAPVKFADPSLPVGMGSKHFAATPTSQAGFLADVFPGPSLDLKSLKVSSAQDSDKTTRKRKKSSDPADAVLVSVTTPFIDSNPVGKKALGAEESVRTSFIPRSKIETIHTPAVVSHSSTSVSATTSVYMPRSLTNQFFSLNPPSVSGDTQKRVDLAVDNRTLNIDDFSKAEEAKLQAQEAGANAAAAVAYCESVWRQLSHQNISSLKLDSDSKLTSAAAVIAAAASVAKAAAASAKIAASIAQQEKQMFEEVIIMSRTAKTIEFDACSVSNSMSSLSNASPPSILSGLDNHPTSAIVAAREASRKKLEAASAATRHAANLDAVVKAAELAAEAVSHAGKIVSMTEPLSLSKLVEAGPSNYWKDLLPESFSASKPNDKDTRATPDFYKNHQEPSDSLGVSSMKEGSHVEVLRDFGNSKTSWFSATVLSLRDGEAFVCYNDILSEKGTEQLKEWVSTEAKDDVAPRIRRPHPLTSVHLERTKKRPRDAVKDYNWSLGDKVDAWVQNCWCEAIVSEKNEKDDTVLSVEFLDKKETALVKVWNLRPSLTWNGAQWVEWSKSGSNNVYKGDTPAQKRAKIASEINKGKGIPETDSAEMPSTEVPTLPLSENEKKFSVGSKMEGTKPKVFRGTRSGLGKERSGVVFGIPKPGKKRKFMEVSKHYVSEQSGKPNIPSDSARLAKFLAPHGLSSRSKLGGLKEKQASMNKTKAARSGKPPSRTSFRKDDSASSKHEDSQSAHLGKDSASESELGKQNVAESGSTSNQEENSGGEAMVFSAAAIPQSSRKKAPRSTLPQHLRQGRFPVPNGRSVRGESNETSESVEPRRSVRRIQPTSRLLEGLQSSLIISKLPSTSHDKSNKSKGTATRGNNNRG